MNGIITTHCASESGDMSAFARDAGVEYAEYRILTPTLFGDASPLEHQVDACREEPGDDARTPHFECHAGRTFFHVDCAGRASICKTSRRQSIDLVREGLTGLHALPHIASTALARPAGCAACPQAATCRSCTPDLVLRQESGTLSPAFCATGILTRKEES